MSFGDQARAPVSASVEASGRRRGRPPRIGVGAPVAVIGFAGLVALLTVASYHAFIPNSDGATVVLEGQSMGTGNLLLRHWALSHDSFWTVDAPFYAIAVLVAGVRPRCCIVPAVMAASVVLTGSLLARHGRRGPRGILGRGHRRGPPRTARPCPSHILPPGSPARRNRPVVPGGLRRTAPRPLGLGMGRGGAVVRGVDTGGLPDGGARDVPRPGRRGAGHGTTRSWRRHHHGHGSRGGARSRRRRPGGGRRGGHVHGGAPQSDGPAVADPPRHRSPRHLGRATCWAWVTACSGTGVCPLPLPRSTSWASWRCWEGSCGRLSAWCGGCDTATVCPSARPRAGASTIFCSWRLSPICSCSWCSRPAMTSPSRVI